MQCTVAVGFRPSANSSFYRIQIIIFVCIKEVAVFVQYSFVVPAGIGLVDSVASFGEFSACVFHKKVHALTDVGLRSGCNQVKVIVHQNKAVDFQIVDNVCQEKEVFKGLPNLIHGKREPVSINGSGSDMVGKLSLLESFSSGHRVETFQGLVFRWHTCTSSPRGSHSGDLPTDFFRP